MVSSGHRRSGSYGSNQTVLPAHWQPGHCDNVPQRPTETRKMLAPKRQAKPRTLVPSFGRRTASSDSDSSLRLAAQQDHEIRALAGLRAQLLVRNDQGRPRRRHLGDTIDVLRNHNPVKCSFRLAWLLRYRLDLGAFARPRMWLDHVAVRTSAVQ